jgi:hypothetical protein
VAPVSLAQMRVNPDGSVVIPQYSPLSGLAAMTFQIPQTTVFAANRPNCEIVFVAAPFMGQPKKVNFIYFNRINDFGFDQSIVPQLGTVIHVRIHSEEPAVCTEGGGTRSNGVPLPQNFNCDTFQNPTLADVVPDKVESVQNAIKYLYTNYCKLAPKKNAF